MVLVSVMEAMLFAATAVALVWAAERHQADRRLRNTDLVLIALFALAALRAALWAGLGNVLIANIAVLVAGVGLAVWTWIKRPLWTANDVEIQ